MKKYIITLLLLCPVFVFADIIKDYQKEYDYLSAFRAEGTTRFKAKPMTENIFTVTLKKDSQYCFIAKGTDIFHIQVVEVSNGKENGWEGIFSRYNKAILLENVQEVTQYRIKIYTFTDNDITIYWGRY